ncbi:MAG: hypothetical protein ACR2MN_14955 [Acidimicrobiales bacterium]
MIPLLVTREEAASALHVEPTAVDRLVVDGRLPQIRLFPDDGPMFTPESLVRLIDAAALTGQ